MNLQMYPPLAIDDILGEPGARGMGERFIVWNLIRHMNERGWKLESVNDGDRWRKVANAEAAMERIFDLDISWISFRKVKTAVTHTVMLVLGNSPDEVVSDYSFNDTDSFSDDMESFDAEAAYQAYLHGEYTKG